MPSAPSKSVDVASSFWASIRDAGSGQPSSRPQPESLLHGLCNPVSPDEHLEAPDVSDSDSQSCNSGLDDLFHIKECPDEKLPDDYE